MLYLNKTIIPDPDNATVLDAYGGEAGPELVALAVDCPYPDRINIVTCAFRGSIVDVREDRLAAVLVSAGLHPLGRLERRERGVKQRPEDFDITAAVNDLGPRLRTLREQTGLRMFELAHALRCSTVQLSRVELGEWAPNWSRVSAFARRLAEIAVDAYKSAKYEEEEVEVVAAALARHVGPDDREAVLPASE